MAANNTSGVLWAEFRKPSGTQSLGVIADLQAVARHEPFRIAGKPHQRAWSFSTQAARTMTGPITERMLYDRTAEILYRQGALLMPACI
jgi:hypothetical protein